ncbi:MAG: DUF4065 domain-containing protein [Patescibacteria group bacterium]|nr:DUF4065 domain-containing protein [Patescibacteria group bacterium]
MVNTYAKTIKTLRQANKFSQQEVAKKLGISRPSYVALEQGKRELSLKEAGIISELFGISLEEFLPSVTARHRKYEQMLFAFLRHTTRDGRLPKTKLAKLLYLADFGWFYNMHKSMSGLPYRKIEYGPVPNYYFALLAELDRDGKIAIESKGKVSLISETRVGEKIGDDLLGPKEKKFIKEVAKKWRDKNTKEIVDFTHNQLPYTFADEGAVIPYELITQEDPEHVY